MINLTAATIILKDGGEIRLETIRRIGDKAPGISVEGKGASETYYAGPGFWKLDDLTRVIMRDWVGTTANADRVYVRDLLNRLTRK